MKKIKLLVLMSMAFFVFWKIFLPGPMVANDFPLATPSSIEEGFGLPQTWSLRGAAIGEYVVSTLWAWPVDFLYGLGGTLGLSFSILERILGIFPILILVVWGVGKLLDYYSIKGWGKYIATLFYLVNSYILLVIDGGQLAIGLAYAWMPMAFLMIEKSIKSGFKRKILAGLSVSILGFFDIRFIYVLLVLVVLRFLYQLLVGSRTKLLHRYISSGLVIGIILLGLNAYWIIPAVLARAPALPAAYQRVTQTSFLSFSTLGHSLFLLQPHWFKNVFGQITSLRAEFVLIPILVFLAPVLRRKSREVGFWLLVALVGVFLVKGANPPFPGVYPWLFTNVPGFSLFRDPTKFFFLVALSYSILIGITVNEITKRINWSLVISEAWRSALGHWSFKIVPLVLSLYFVWLVRPVWLGQMTGTFAAPIYQDEYFALAEKLEKDKDFGRVFWIPTRAPLGFSSSAHPSVEASRLVQKRPFAIGTVGTYEIFNFLREAPFMGELFDIAGIDYIAYPYPDTRREELSQDNIDYYFAFSDQIKNLDWVDDKMIYHTPVNVFKTSKNADHFFLAENTFLIVGSDRVYWDLINIDGFDLSKNALMFTEEQPGLGAQIPNYASVILYDKEPIDFAVTFIDKSNFVFPAAQLDFDPNETGWWKRETADLISWRNFLQQKYGIDNLDFGYGGGWAVAEGDRQLNINHQSLAINHILLARVMRNSNGGKIEFYQGDVKVEEIDTKISDPDTVEVKLTGYGEIENQAFEYNKADFGWFEVGKLTINHQPLTIKTKGEINVINAIAAISEEEWKRINESIHQYKIINWDELTNQQKTSLFASKGDEVELSYQRISPTHYKVRVEGVKEPVTLAFSETYDQMWKLHGQEALPIYSLINGFTILEDGEYNLFFSAQQYVIPGLYISGLTLIVVSVLLIRSRKKS